MAVIFDNILEMLHIVNWSVLYEVIIMMVLKINIVWWTALSSNSLQNSVGLLWHHCWSLVSILEMPIWAVLIKNAYMGCCLLLTEDPLPLFSFLFLSSYISQSTKRRKVMLFSILYTVYFVLPSVEDSPKLPEWHLASFQFLTIFPILFLFGMMEKVLLFGWLVATDCRYDLLNLGSFIN